VRTWTGLRAFLLLVGAAAGAAGATLLLALGLPLLARGALGAQAFVALVAAAALLATGVAAMLLFRRVAAPVERILSAGARLGTGPAEARLPLVGEGGFALPEAALAFERVVTELDEERGRLAAKVDELIRTNRELAATRESLVRSEQLATLGRLAAGLAHEVGNPLGAITGYVELARSRLPAGADPELPGALDRIGAAADRIDRTVRDLLDFARPPGLTLAPVDLPAALDGALRLARVQARFRRVDVELALAPDASKVLGDERHLGQVLLNLLLNAGDAMRGEGRVRIAAGADGRWPDGAARVRLVVADDGPGIAPDDLPRVFEPFFTTKEAGEGTGLGLAITRRIIESFGGVVAAENAPAGGAVFTLLLRAPPAAEAP
jgi:signal transduction histidine kinase